MSIEGPSPPPSFYSKKRQVYSDIRRTLSTRIDLLESSLAQTLQEIEKLKAKNLSLRDEKAFLTGQKIKETERADRYKKKFKEIFAKNENLLRESDLAREENESLKESVFELKIEQKFAENLKSFETASMSKAGKFRSSLALTRSGRAG